MSEPQHPQAEGAAMNAERPGHGAAPHATQYAYQGPLDSLAAVGARLAQLREAKGWSVDDVSARLKVSPAKMRALEAGNISQLPGTTFALGVVRSYAKMLGTDPAPFAQALRREKGEPEPDLSMPASTGTDLPRGRVSVSLGSSTQKHRSWWWGVAAVVVGLIALVMWHTGGDSTAWFARLKANANGATANAGGASETMVQGQTVTSVPTTAEQNGAALAPAAASAEEHASGVTVAASAPSAAAPGSSEQAVVRASVQGSVQASAGQSASTAQAGMKQTPQASAPAAVSASVPSAASSAAESASREASAASADDAAAVPAGASTIVVRVSQDSWFSVRDKNGKEVFSGLVHAGDAKEIAGAAPFKVVAGNRAGLESLTLDGQPVDAAKYGTDKGNVVRFSLP